jgi:hypothetical protein
MIKMTWLRASAGVLMTLVTLGTTARGQGPGAIFGGGGAGSTLEGDYLRGVGAAAWSMGLFNLYTAQADRINTETFIEWNEYVQNCYRQMSKEYNERNRAIMAKSTEALNKRRQRMLETPEELDLMKADTLNMIMEKLLDPRISESSYRAATVPLSVDLIRRIPFKLADRNEKFSMERLLPHVKGKWPVALQDPRFDLYRRAYERAVDRALEQAIEGKAQLGTIEAIEKTVDDLQSRLSEVVRPDEQRLQSEALAQLAMLKATVRLFQTHNVQRALGDIDKYSGTNVNDLKNFMQKYNLRFAPAESPEERRLYPELYTLLEEQRSKVASPAIMPEK